MMMKRTALILILLLFILASAFSYVELDKRSMDIVAVKGAYHNIIVKPIYGSVDDPAGMPFDLTADDVKFVNETNEVLGREIAQWSMHSNFAPVTIKISAPALKMTASYSGTEESDLISYFLYFPYRYTDGAGKIAEDIIKVESDNSHSFVIDGVEGRVNTGTFPVRFMLSKDSSDNIKDYEPGLYTANVTITVDGTQ